MQFRPDRESARYDHIETLSSIKFFRSSKCINLHDHIDFDKKRVNKKITNGYMEVVSKNIEKIETFCICYSAVKEERSPKQIRISIIFTRK